MAYQKTSVEFFKRGLPKIVMSWEIEHDISQIVDATSREVGWIGEVIREDDNTFRIVKVTVPHQMGNYHTTEIEDEDIVKLMEEEPDFEMERWRYWGHSHHTMGVSPSGQDHTQMKEFAESCKWFIGTIHNKSGDVYGYIIDNELGIYYKDVEVVVERIIPESVRDWKKIVDDRLETYRASYKIDKYPSVINTKGNDKTKDKGTPELPLVWDAWSGKYNYYSDYMHGQRAGFNRGQAVNEYYKDNSQDHTKKKEGGIKGKSATTSAEKKDSIGSDEQVTKVIVTQAEWNDWKHHYANHYHELTGLNIMEYDY